jgi:repressor LexA
VIYFFRAGDTDQVKIGKAADPATRLRELQTGHAEKLVVVRLLEGGHETEKWLHKHYAARRLQGEWFRFCESMLTIEPPSFEKAPIAAVKAQVKDRLHRSFLRHAPPDEVPATQLAEALGISDCTVANYRKGKIPHGLVDMVIQAKASPEFADAVAYLIFEGMDPVHLKEAILQRIRDRMNAAVTPEAPIALPAEPAPATPSVEEPRKQPIAFGLTKKQLELLTFLRKWAATRPEVGPSYAEMAAGIGIVSKSGVNRLVVALEERGCIRRLPNRARSIEVLAA